MQDDWDNTDVSSDFSPQQVPRDSMGIGRRKEKVKDDWDADDEDAEDTTNTEPSRRLVQQDEWPSLSESRGVANTRQIAKPRPNTQNAMPSLPPEVFEPPMRILKRPKGSGTQTPTSPAAKSDKETLQEREEKYKIAREKIFGTPSPGPVSSSPPRVASPGVVKMGNSGGLSTKPSRAVREPLGPETQTAFARKPGNPGRGQIQLQTKPARPRSEGP